MSMRSGRRSGIGQPSLVRCGPGGPSRIWTDDDACQVRSVLRPRRAPRRDAAPGGARASAPREGASPRPPRGRGRGRCSHAPDQRGLGDPVGSDAPPRVRHRAPVDRHAAIGRRRVRRFARSPRPRPGPGRRGAPPPPTRGRLRRRFVSPARFRPHGRGGRRGRFPSRRRSATRAGPRSWPAR